MQGTARKTASIGQQRNTAHRKKRQKKQAVSRMRPAAYLLCILLLLVGLIHMLRWFSSYSGIGDAATLPESPYQTSAFFYTEDGRLCYEDSRFTSETVIDVSTYQKNIDWQQVADDGIDMAMIRLGYRGYKSGKLNLDAYYKENVKAARKAGLTVGVYFFSQAVSVEEAEAEARFVMRHIRGKHIDGPIAFDMEPIHGAERISNLTVEQKTEIADAFCQLLEKNGHHAVIYGNPDWLQNHLLLDHLTDYPIWLAHYTASTNWPYRYEMWQYTTDGKVSGVRTGGVDLSIRMIEKDSTG